MSFDLVVEIVLFYSTVSKSSKNCINAMKTLNTTPASQILKAVRLDSISSRKAASGGTLFSIRGVPTIVVTTKDSKLQVFEGEPKAFAWLGAYYNWLSSRLAPSRIAPSEISSRLAPSEISSEQSYNEEDKGKYIPPPYPISENEDDNPYILKSASGSKLNFKPVGSGYSGQNEEYNPPNKYQPPPIHNPPPMDNRSVGDESNSFGDNSEKDDPQFIDMDIDMQSKPTTVYTPEFGDNSGVSQTKKKDKKDKKEKKKEKKDKKNRKHSESEEIDFLDDEPPSRPPVQKSKQSSGPESMESLSQKAKKMAEQMSSQYGYDLDT